MIIFLQAAGLLNVIIVLFFFLMQRKIMLKSTKLFLVILILSCINLAIDTFSLIMIDRHNVFSDASIYLVCKIYLVTMALITELILIYMMRNLFRKIKHFLLIAGITLFVNIALCIAIIFTPIRYVITPSRGVTDYTEGPSVMLTYAACVINVVTIGIVAIIKRNTMNKKKRITIAIWILTWIVSALVQFINNKIIVVGYALSIGTLVIYAILENPASYHDNKTALFNESGMYEYLMDLYVKNAEFEILILHLTSTQKDLLKRNNSELFIVLAEWIKSIIKFNVFIKDDNDLAIIIPKNDIIDAKATIDYIDNEILNMGKLNLAISSISFKYVLIENPYLYSRPIDLLEGIRLSTPMINKNNKQIFKIDESVKKYHETNMQIINKIEYALKNDMFEVYYQPIYSFEKKKFVSCEALVRMHDKSGKIIMPTEFIPIAEQNDLICEIGEVVFDKVCRFISSEDFKKITLDYIEVNLSMVQFVKDEYSTVLMDIMKKYNVDPKRINFEITETGGNGDLGVVTYANMNELISNGSTFSLDDFGTGNSNLNYIANLPVNIIKFDKKMVDSFFENEKAKYIMDTAIKMIKGLKLEIVLEGIENKEQLDAVKCLGVDFIQGYYFSKPLSQAEFLDFIRKYEENTVLV